MAKALGRHVWGLAAAALLAGGCVGEEPTVPSFAPCAAPLLACGGSCVDTDIDALNCGACGTTCNVEAGQVCSGGACVLACPPGTTTCGGSCIDTKTDAAHCGNCTTACDTSSGEVCSSGTCTLVCGGGTANCGGDCVDTATDPSHCGDCDTACDDGQVCSAGHCGLSCGGGTSLCDARCVDFASDPLHCGDCKTACDTKAGETCEDGTCAVPCAGGTTRCGDACIDPNVDPSNCGACGVRCGKNASCDAGGCTCAGGYEGDGQTCSDVDECAGDNDCSPNGECINTTGSYACRCRDTQTGDGKTCTGLELVTVASVGPSAGAPSLGTPTGLAISADARYVAFVSDGGDLASAASDGTPQAYVRDVLAHTTDLASVNDSGTPGDGKVYALMALSADGTHVAFTSVADNLDGGNASLANVFVRDLPNATTTLGSGTPRSGSAFDADEPALSDDGSVVAFESATRLTSKAVAHVVVYVNDPANPGSFVLVSANAAGTPPAADTSCTNDARADAEYPSVSGDGTRVVFDTAGIGLTDDDDSNCTNDVFLRDLSNPNEPVTTLVSATPDGAACTSPPGAAGSLDAVLSADGNFVAFDSTCNDLLEKPDQLTSGDVFVRDLVKGTLTRVSVSTSGGEGNDDSFEPQISADGRYVAFTSYAKNLVAGETSDGGHVFVRDMVAKTTIRVDPDMIGDAVVAGTASFALAGNGAAVAFIALENLPASDTQDLQLYLRYLR